MLFKIGFFITSLALFASCGNNSSEIKKEVIKADTASVELDKCVVLFNEAKRFDTILLKATVINNDIAEQAIKAFYEFSNNCTTDTLAPVFLVKAGQVAQSIRKYTQAQAFFIKCAEEFPKFNNRGVALFLLAQLYDNASMLNNETEARTIYEQIIREYPKTTFANDSRACIKNLGKTDEQLIQEFLKKNK
jgi:tetratricopeptide (TPR) repeat protein